MNYQIFLYMNLLLKPALPISSCYSCVAADENIKTYILNCIFKNTSLASVQGMGVLILNVVELLGYKN